MINHIPFLITIIKMKTTLTILDNVNCKFSDLDVGTRRAMIAATKFFVPNAYFSPAYKMGRWDGTKSFCSLGGATFINILDKVLPIVIDAGYEIEIDDQRTVHNFTFPEVDEFLLSDITWPENHPFAGDPILLREHQVRAIQTFFDNPNSLQEIATSAGKTIITGALAKLTEGFGRSITIVPSKSLILQTEEDYRNIGLDTGVFYGDRKEIGHQHTICTWQSLASVWKNRHDMNADVTMDDLIDGVTTVITDECHQAKADLLSEMLTGPLANIPLRWGLTGTIPKDDIGKYTLLSCIGECVGKVTAKELQEKGIISNLDIKILETDDTHVEFSDYQSEKQYLTTNPERLEYIAKLISDLSLDGNTLVLVERIETGELLRDIIPDSVFLSGSVKNTERKEEFDSIQNSDNKILIASYGIASTGISIPRIFNLVLLESGKSFVRVIQSIGRGIRKAKDKDYVRIIDVSSTLKYSNKHMKVRRTYYKDAQYPYSLEKVKYNQ